MLCNVSELAVGTTRLRRIHRTRDCRITFCIIFAIIFQRTVELTDKFHQSLWILFLRSQAGEVLPVFVTLAIIPLVFTAILIARHGKELGTSVAEMNGRTLLGNSCLRSREINNLPMR